MDQDELRSDWHEDHGLHVPANASSPTAPKAVRGGSWYDRSIRARSSFRVPYLPHQGVYDVGFRVICEQTPAAVAQAVAGAAKK